ncbi:MAG: isoaspartyl peptidase/L-asparaginase [Bacteroidota bacterium]
MKIFLIILMTLLLPLNVLKSQNKENEYVIVIHGGAGYMTEENTSVEKQKQYIDIIETALQTGKKMLDEGKNGLDVVEAIINIFEDSPLFNAGKGAVFTHQGKNELDASIMDGNTLNAGAVAGVTDIKNPISAARKVMTNSNHVLLTGNGASEFAKEQGLEIVDPKYFYTEENYRILQDVIKNESEKEDSKHGTVGCVVLDKEGNLAAGTSTGGMTNKRYGRVGDSPIIGAGTYASNKTCAVSCTGHGEYFIRYAVAYDLSAMMEYKQISVDQASEIIINEKLKNAGGSGGLIAVDKEGNIAMKFNTPGMIRAYLKSDGSKEIKFFKD